jgi:hypothetical protein
VACWYLTESENTGERKKGWWLVEGRGGLGRVVGWGGARARVGGRKNVQSRRSKGKPVTVSFFANTTLCNVLVNLAFSR